MLHTSSKLSSNIRHSRLTPIGIALILTRVIDRVVVHNRRRSTGGVGGMQVGYANAMIPSQR